MNNGLSYEVLYSQLFVELAKIAPLPEEDLLYLESLDLWIKETKKLCKQLNSSTLPPKGVRALIDEHNAERPRRKVGRPRAHLPSKQHIREQLISFLAEQGLRTLPSDPGEQLKALAKKILREPTNVD
jgi:hypothetical protein